MLEQKESQCPRWALAGVGKREPLRLVQRAQAATANVQALGGLTLLNSNLLDIGQPAAFGCALGMAYLVAKLWAFSADITSYWHQGIPLSHVDEALTSKYCTTRGDFRQVWKPFGFAVQGVR